MSQVIIYKNDNGGVSVIYPTAEAVAAYSIEAIAKKDVPAGKPYKIIDASELPETREERNNWDIDVSELTDGFCEEGFIMNPLIEEKE